jgi:hypothetical protein
MKSAIANGVKYRKHANDEFYTPLALAKNLIELVPFAADDLILDPAPGPGAFYNQFPGNRARCPDFFEFAGRCDWAITNPPYSKLDAWFERSTKVCDKGFAYLLGFHNITPRRIEMCEKAGFGLTKVHLCKVFKWFGISAFVVFEKGGGSLLSYDRTVWHSEAE